MKHRFWKIAACATVCLLSSPELEARFDVAPAQREVEGNEPQKHTVKKGETLFGISRQYKVSVGDIQVWNGLSNTAIKEGQTLIVSKPKMVVEKAVESVVERPVADQPVEKTPVNTATATEHIVQPGETLFGIARQYGMTLADLKKKNRLSDVEIQVGQRLAVGSGKAIAQDVDPLSAPNPHQGTDLITMISETEEEAVETEEPMEVVTEMDVLAVPAYTTLSPDAKISDYTDEHTGKKFKRIEEGGMAGRISDFSTDQTKFYAFHKYLPSGSYIRVDFPDRGQSILCEVKNTLSKEDSHVVLLTAKCMEYLRMTSDGGDVVLRYVVPLAD